jgi:glycerol-3-phosphate dehydrogenase
VSYEASAFPKNTNTLPLVPDHPEVTTGVLRHIAQHEAPAHLVDILFRRTNLGWQVKLPPDAIRCAAEAVADVLNWDEDRVKMEIDDYKSYVRKQHLVS